jgi:hypothetical protein
VRKSFREEVKELEKRIKLMVIMTVSALVTSIGFFGAATLFGNVSAVPGPMPRGTVYVYPYHIPGTDHIKTTPVSYAVEGAAHYHLMKTAVGHLYLGH